MLFLGDSFTFGWALSYEDTFVGVFDMLAGPDVTAVNAGVPGYGPWQERIFLNERGFHAEPDLVVFQAFVANDIEETLWRTRDHLHAYLVERRLNLLPNQLADHWQVRLDNRLHRSSAVSNLVFLRTLKIRFPLTRALNRIGVFGRVAIPEFEASVNRPWQYEPDLAHWYPKLEQGWKFMCDDIMAIREDCRERGIPFAAFAIPTSIDLAEDPSTTDDNWVADKGTRLLHSFFDEKGIIYLPLLDSIRAHSEPETLYFHGDRHLNEAGARLVGEALAAWIPELRASVQPPAESR